MSQFLQWFEQEKQLDPVLKAGIAHLWFITIHPFEDGNGRIARAITDMALARADGSASRFYSLSTQIEAEKTAYYVQLEAQQRHTSDITDRHSAPQSRKIGINLYIYFSYSYCILLLKAINEPRIKFFTFLGRNSTYCSCKKLFISI
jgi:prophage maintenance system killer protein